MLLWLLACGANSLDSANTDRCDNAGDHPLLTWYPDQDHDGWGDVSQPHPACIPDGNWVLAGPDCSPGDEEVNPAALEICNGKDDDCDNRVDESDDLDGDGYLAPSCGGGDCDDANVLSHPDAFDACEDGIDRDCDGVDPGCVPDLPVSDADSHLTGSYANFEAGRLLVTGDTNGDGVADLLLSTLAAENVAGGAYLLPGPLTTGSLEERGYRLKNEETGGGAGRSIAMGDLNGDGLLDVGVGIPFGAHCAESIFFGPLKSAASLNAPDLLITNSAEGFCGHGSDFPDVNGDGVADLAIGAYAEGTGAFEAGTVYVNYGPFTTGSVDLSARHDALLIGEGASFWTGRVLRSAGDLNGDGTDDLLFAAVGANLGGPDAGAAYVVYGPPPETLLLNAADGRLVGEAPYDYAGIALASGDINGDGLSDVVVGAQSSHNATSCGAAYVVPGPAAGDQSLAVAPYIVRGTGDGQLAGAGLAVGDVDGDGGLDLVVGAPGDDGGGPDSGAAYLFLKPETGTRDLVLANARLVGDAGTQAGWGVAVGDVDGDGAEEVLMGAPMDDGGGTSAGIIHVFSY